MFRALPFQGGTPRQISEVVNNLLNGKSNNTGTITLATGNATSTTLYDERISVDTKIILIPFSDNAETDSAPFGQFSSSADQTATTIGDETILSYDSEDFSNGVYLSNSSRINFRNAGKYAVQFSLQAINSTNAPQDIDVWFKKNGSNLSASNSRFGFEPRKSISDPFHLILATTIFFDIAAGDYLQIAWRPTDVGVKLEHYPAVAASAGVTPAIPATPSAFVTVQYIAPYAYSNVYVSSQTTGQATITHFANSTANKTYAYILVG